MNSRVMFEDLFEQHPSGFDLYPEKALNILLAHCDRLATLEEMFDFVIAYTNVAHVLPPGIHVAIIVYFSHARKMPVWLHAWLSGHVTVAMLEHGFPIGYIDQYLVSW